MQALIFKIQNKPRGLWRFNFIAWRCFAGTLEKAAEGRRSPRR
jgi:hypothetical protein